MSVLEDFDLVEDDEEEKEKALKITIASTLADLAGEDTFADVYFIVGEGKKQRSIPAHRVVLAVNSDVFEAMLYPFPFNEKDEAVPKISSCEIPEIVIKDVNPLAFRTMLHCLYSDKGDINASELVDLLHVAKKFQLRRLSVVCQEFLKNGVTVDNVCTLFSKAQHLEEVRTIAYSFIEDKAKEVLKSDGFYNLSKDCVKQILSSGQLNIDEIEIFSACTSWSVAECKRQNLEESIDNKKNILEDLLPLVRFPVMKIDEIAQSIGPSQILSKSQVLQLFTYLGNEKEKRSEVNMDFNTEPREAVLKWIFHTTHKSTRITLEKTLVASNRLSNFAYCIGNKPMTKGKYCWKVEQKTFGKDSWLLLGVSSIKSHTDDATAEPNDSKVWGLTSDSKQYAGNGKNTKLETDFTNGPFHLLLDCETGTLEIANMFNQKTYSISNLSKKESILTLDGGGFVPYFNLKKCSITVTPMSSKKFNTNN